MSKIVGKRGVMGRPRYNCRINVAYESPSMRWFCWHEIVTKRNMNDPLHDNDCEKVIIPVIEESIHIEKEIVETGRVKITKSVTEQEEQVSVPYTSDHITVEHVSINKYVDTPPGVRNEGDTMIIPVLKEVVFIEKRLLLVEEVRVTTHKEKNILQVPLTLRKEAVFIEHLKTDEVQSLNKDSS